MKLRISFIEHLILFFFFSYKRSFELTGTVELLSLVNNAMTVFKLFVFTDKNL